MDSHQEKISPDEKFGAAHLDEGMRYLLAMEELYNTRHTSQVSALGEEGLYRIIKPYLFDTIFSNMSEEYFSPDCGQPNSVINSAKSASTKNSASCIIS
jgi:hypothetical protein